MGELHATGDQRRMIAEVSRGRIFEQEQIARAVELGLGVTSPEKIRFVTGDAESATYASKIM